MDKKNVLYIREVLEDLSDSFSNAISEKSFVIRYFS